jgi:hypothetical protein
MAAVHRALDGVQFHLDGDLDLSCPATSVAEVVIGDRLHEFTAGPPTLGRDVAATVGIDAFTEQLGYHGGTLHTATKRIFDDQALLVEELLIGAWQGTRHALVTQLYRGSTAELLGILRALNVSEHEDGVSLKPDSKAGCQFANPATIMKEIPGLGLLELSTPTNDRRRQLAGLDSKTTANGELFADWLTDGSPYFILEAPGVWMTVVPLAGNGAERVPALVDRLHVHTKADGGVRR